MKLVGLSFLFAIEYTDSALSQSQELVLTGINGYRSDPVYSVLDGVGDNLAISDSAGKDDLINLALKNCSACADVLADLVDESVTNKDCLLVAILAHLVNFSHVVGSKISIKSAVADDLLLHLIIGIFA